MIGDFPAGYTMSLTGKGIRKTGIGTKVYTTHGAKKRLFIVLILVTISYMAHLLFAMSLGRTQNGDVRFLTCVPALCMFAFCVIFAYCSTLSKTVTRRRIIFCIGVFMDMSLAGFVGMLSASSSGLNELRLVVIPFMCAGYVSIFLCGLVGTKS